MKVSLRRSGADFVTQIMGVRNKREVAMTEHDSVVCPVYASVRFTTRQWSIWEKLCELPLVKVLFQPERPALDGAELVSINRRTASDRTYCWICDKMRLTRPICKLTNQTPLGFSRLIYAA